MTREKSRKRKKKRKIETKKGRLEGKETKIG
jgi:hypothetical protein